MTAEALAALAKDAMTRAYAPYSGFHVGAALLCGNGRVYTGCNIENASYGATNCAERTAIFSAINDGVREFSAIAVAGGLHGEITGFTPPCGICRQVLREFCRDDFKIILVGKDNALMEKTMKEPLPLDFSAEEMK